MIISGTTRIRHNEGSGPTGLQIYNIAVLCAGPDPQISAILVLCKNFLATPILLLSSIPCCVTGPAAGLGMAYCANR